MREQSERKEQENKEYNKCSLCNIQYNRIMERMRRYKTVGCHTVCEECYNELFRFSKIKRKPIEYIYDRFGFLIKKIRINEVRGLHKQMKNNTQKYVKEVKELCKNEILSTNKK